MTTNKVNPIKNFFCDQEVFITGASGLIGKSVIEKLLRSCSGIKRIYMLLREKKGVSTSDRLEKFKQSQIFDVIRSEGRSDDLNKLVALNGDICEINLGLSTDDLNRLQNVSIVFHIAATVRFDEPLRSAILQNVRGTREAIRIAEGLKNLKQFVHCSTAYCNPFRTDVDEKLYDMYTDWETCIKLTEKFDDKTLDVLTPKIINNFPNTYSFSKHVAEHLVNSFKDRMPLVIFRPTIVINSIKEPFPGWYDGLTGAAGLITCTGLGLIRVINADPKTMSDFVSLDLTANLLIIIAWKESCLPPLKSDENVRIYHLSSGEYIPQTLEQLFSMLIEHVQKTPFNKTLWIPRLTYCSNMFFYRLQVILFHIIPAIFLDQVIRLTGNKPFLLKVHRKITASQNSIIFFINNSFKFKTTRIFNLADELEEIPDFEIKYGKDIQPSEYCPIVVAGLRKFLMKDSDDSSKALSRMKIMKVIDTAVYFIFYYWIIKKCFNILLTFF